ncbi:NADPH-dependent aldehyde reductase Ahr [Flavihumibacter solisilvae]|uniref:alcohol dehydrogenase (NADP(+)) n=1 Tax=Flavihumibacter solisilvae TaxID=1349421 RepID=A0A0C1L6P3_9BACT|nr:NAD(P)-dependent alcohol dehydrogenase [Flavihumibacter solisilvae]KIC91298.1 alcohol dehydrogenase [Flavihumibacter solisilvae]
MSIVKAWAAFEKNGKLEPFTFDLPPITDEEVEIEVEHCGICYSDLGVIRNELGFTTYPLVPGHEVTGRIAALGSIAANKGLRIGQKVGLGWFKFSCGHCDPCLQGQQNLCTSIQGTILGNHGGWAERVRTHWIWAIPIPGELDARDAGPLMCAGITVFAPLLEFGVRPTDHIGIIGIGGLGHLAVKFASAWGARVTAFSSSTSKYDDIKKLGADDIVSSRDSSQWGKLKGKLDFILVTVTASMEWDKIISLLAPNGRLHFVGIIPEPIPVSVLSLLIPQASVSSSPGGSRPVLDKMLRFAALHGISPITEHWPMSKVNEAISNFEAGKSTYRIVLDADF